MSASGDQRPTDATDAASAMDASPEESKETQEIAELRRQAESLSERLREADYAYYVLDSPIISDAEYDTIMRALRALEEAHPEVISPDSPTQRVAGEPGAGFAKFRHLSPVLSLATVRTPEELLAWRDRAQSILPEAD
ncbi:MAG TPA: hypothetical protein VF739_07175, partial [Ktedonobacterales bacterium]